MTEIIEDGAGDGYKQRITWDKRAYGDVITEPISSERSRQGRLWGLGTGSLSLTTSVTAPILWFRNDSTDEDWYVQKLIAGWNGGTTNHNTTAFSLISYNTPEPSANNTAIDAQIENIKLSGSNAPVVHPNFAGYKWDGVSTGMTVGSGGFAQIPNRFAIGNHSIPIDGEIILGPGNSMQFQTTVEEDGLYQMSVVFYTVPLNKARGEQQ